jgi:hypothetical protein
VVLDMKASFLSVNGAAAIEIHRYELTWNELRAFSDCARETASSNNLNIADRMCLCLMGAVWGMSQLLQTSVW